MRHRQPPRSLVAGLRLALAMAVTSLGAFAQTAEPVASDPLLDSLGRYAAAETAVTEYRPVHRGEGAVFVGRIAVPPNVVVATRTTIQRDGSFATAVYPGRTLVFYAHGHDPLVVSEGTEIFPKLRDAGELRFTPTPPELMRTAVGQARLADNSPSAPRIQTTLGITNLSYLWRDHGHRGGNLTVDVRTVSLRSGDAFHFDGLSAIPYHIRFTAEGYITRQVELPPKATGKITLGPIILDRAPVLTFTYLPQIDLSAPDDWSTAAPQSQTITCDGDTRFLYTDARDRLRNKFYLRLKPGKRHVEASFWAIPSEFYDLGRGKLADYTADHSWIDRLPKHKPAIQQALVPGRVYFFRNVGRDTSCLFAVE